MVAYIKVGHVASHRQIPHELNFTHDWEAYIDPVDDAKLELFIEKVVFTLHDTFQQPVRGKWSVIYKP